MEQRIEMVTDSTSNFVEILYNQGPFVLVVVIPRDLILQSHLHYNNKYQIFTGSDKTEPILISIYLIQIQQIHTQRNFSTSCSAEIAVFIPTTVVLTIPTPKLTTLTTLTFQER